MIWRWLISSRLFAAGFFTAFAAVAPSATISGKVVLRDSRVTAVSKLGNYSGVVISLVPLDGPAEPEPHRARMLQKDKTFVPHVLAISTGSTVDFPNADPIFHSAFSSYSGQIFDVGLYPPGTNRAVRFTRPGVVRVFCNIHPTMSAVIVVLKTPYFDTTGKDGSFHLSAPAGDYELDVFHERATEATLRGLKRQITVGESAVQLPQIDISESGWLAVPHKNKYGHNYPPGSGDDSLYPGARQ
jgi:plastocyanin